MARAGEVEDWLQEASISVAPTKAERRIAQGAHEELRQLLRSGEMDRRIVRSYLTGSYVRHTATRPIEDVDVVFEIDPARWPQSGWEFLGDGLPKPDAVLATFANAIRLRLRDGGDESRVRKQGRSVGVMFENIRVDVVPAVPDGEEEDDDEDDDEGGDEEEPEEVDDGETESDDEQAWEDVTFFDRVKIPNRRNGSWIDSNPRAHVRIASALNQESNGLFKPAVRLLKIWNAGQGHLVSSFVMETIAAHAFDVFEIRDLSEGVWTTWEFMATRGGLDTAFSTKAEKDAGKSAVCLEGGVLSQISIPDLAGTGDLAESCDAGSVAKLVKRARRAREALDSAIGTRSTEAVHSRLVDLFRLEFES